MVKVPLSLLHVASCVSVDEELEDELLVPKWKPKILTPPSELWDEVDQSVSNSDLAALLKVMVRPTPEAQRSLEGRAQVPTPEKFLSVLG